MERVKTVEQLQKMLSERGEGVSYTGIFDWTFQGNDFEWITEYCKPVDNLLRLENGELQLLRRFWLKKTSKDKDGHIIFEDEQGLTDFSVYLRDVILSHQYELQKLIATLDLEYNPIHNVDEDTSEEYTGAGTNNTHANTQEKGEITNQNTTGDIVSTEYGKTQESTNTNYGAQKDILNSEYGAQKDNTTVNYGTYQEKTNTSYGERTDTNTTTNTNEYGRTTGQWDTSNNVAPMDSDIYHSDTENVNNHHEDAHTDNLSATTTNVNGSQDDSVTHTLNAHDDTTTHNTDAHTDIETHDINEHTDTTTHTQEIHEDTTDRTTTSNGTQKHDNTNINDVNGATTTTYSKHILRKGNIGVTSTQQLINQEREIARFSICEEIRQLFVDNFCIGIYSDGVARETYGRGDFYDDYIL